jgi:hypothetical protein
VGVVAAASGRRNLAWEVKKHSHLGEAHIHDHGHPTVS